MSARADSGGAHGGTMAVGAAGGTSSCGSMVSGVLGRGSRSMSASATSVGGVGRGGRQVATSGGAQDVVGEETINLDGEQEGGDEGFAPDPKMCQDMALEYGASPDSIEFFACATIVRDEYNREFFCNIPTPEAMLVFLKRWCQMNNMY
ncbi:hypothetical protein ZEAMMB73_Zm00001d039630 [Zea mays]|uniref:Uncharacterized protein n=1 Tax=Zea mays TaxID=4577 RepID=A0A1D6MJU8_MAIZE|nr:hypothetical protein ZEAMMB73_Zm00001d039630 [Zea mays]